MKLHSPYTQISFLLLYSQYGAIYLIPCENQISSKVKGIIDPHKGVVVTGKVGHASMHGRLTWLTVAIY